MFRTKIVQRFVNGIEFHELLLPNGKRVATGSLSHCWSERERWEKKLDIQSKAPRKCQRCKHWELTRTLGSMDAPVWHCRDGFSPSDSCQEAADRNRECTRKYYNEHPDELQLTLHFD